MKRSDLSKVIGASVMAAGLVILPATLPASAQSSTSPTTTDSTDTTTTTPRADVYNTDRDVDWGWLGLLGLTGLLGLIPRKREETVHYNSTSTTDRDPVRTDYR
ncbi:MAG TPA: WGxxGxxG family protein [Kamptonema sp.]|nr:WGxxGxxG family protein [Kamptonema sp.]